MGILILHLCLLKTLSSVTLVPPWRYLCLQIPLQLLFRGASLPPLLLSKNDDLANLEKDKPELLPSTPPRAKPTDSSMIAQAKILAKELTTTGLDPTVLLLSKLLDKQMVTSQPMYDPSGSLVKSIGPIEQGENIFVFSKQI